MTFKAIPSVEDLRDHSAESLKRVKQLVAHGAPRPDADRPGFFEVDGDDRVFYVHVFRTGKVWLLATWPRESRLLPPWLSDRRRLSALRDTSIATVRTR